MNIAIIPARGGSKRIKNKNTKFFCGKPIIYYSIKAAIDSKIFDKIIVSTDSSKVEKIAKNFGAEIPFKRPSSLSGDYTTTGEVIYHSIKYLERNYIKPKNICCIYPTAPLVKSHDLISSFKLFKLRKKDFVFAATKFDYPVQRGFYIDNKNTISMVNKKNYNKRSQDLKDVYHDAGQFYWGSYNGWIEKKRMFDKYSSVYLMPKLRVQDIDTLEDWKIAEKLYKLNNDKKKKI
tara:strand:+ start:769 stop:1470 length:702 start_codon:yes stop_codon:yes gene_type:complete